ncbi:MAG: zf-HC2 domain-containing protein [Omnitrophica bacterium]|nr:zf-HC2 domain-containing protein [Candidatus Omnitrophota bacterium]
MDCSKIKKYLYSFLDGELDSQRSLLVKEHISACPLCSLELEQEKKIDSLIRYSIPKEQAPYKLKEALLSRMQGFKKRKVSLFARPVLKPVLATSAIAFLIAALFFSILLTINKPFPVFSESVKDHIKLLQGQLSIDISSQKPEEVHSWLQAKLDFKVMVPDLSSQDVNLLGARVCSLKNKKAAYIMYEKKGHQLSVFMFDAQGLKFPQAKRVAVNNRIFYLSREKGYNSALWIDQGIACVFVSDLSEAELLYLASL